MKNVILGLSAASLLMGTAASAAVQANATTDLNLRAGPGPQFDVIDVIDGEGEVTVTSCLETRNWCEVTYEGQTGWAFADYLTASMDGSAVVVSQTPEVEVEIVRYDDIAAEVGAGATGATIGAIAGSLIAGPVGAVVGGTIAGAAAVDSVPDEVVTYVRTNEVEPVYLEGEVVVGAGIPAEVELQAVPDTEYSYVYVNGVPAVVSTENRTIVSIIR
ncbi:DUF1236 domain-containing protein [Gymnodinialimonas ceratoperidinii]|uniref:DUF1236 domain-containing protein n=1 Tax=Gymnodinialimonas ceratoperidinii TaxID=2856823 RepID=A0A8F6TZ25_9RHOB|nr:DUF1236 domain-containing protein [Gymnodinialimonas ceratoperidinii]QXT40619.1 DUF1236 domain-containing protein [Gymnodinialimonas ceratoperidinii]